MWTVKLHRWAGADEDFEFDTADDADEFVKTLTREDSIRRVEIWDGDRLDDSLDGSFIPVLS